MSIGKSKNKKERKKINDDMVPMWLNWSVATLIATLQLLDIYRLVNPCVFALLRSSLTCLSFIINN